MQLKLPPHLFITGILRLAGVGVITKVGTRLPQDMHVPGVIGMFCEESKVIDEPGLHHLWASLTKNFKEWDKHNPIKYHCM